MPDQNKLRREFGLITVTLLVVGMLVGSGIFQMIIPMSKTGLTESWILLAWISGGVISLLGALTAGGLASVTEDSGGTYEYFRIAFGKFFAFISGWADFMIIGTGASAAIAVLFAESLGKVINIPNPFLSLESFSIAGHFFPFRNFEIKVIAIITVIILTAINAIGTKESGVINNIITTVKLIGILGIIFLGFFFPVQNPVTGPELAGINVPATTFAFLSQFFMLLIFSLWAYEGWIYAANVTGEVVNPRRNIPLALALGIGITVIIYLFVNLAYLKVLPLSSFTTLSDNDVAAISVAEALLGRQGMSMVMILVSICTLSAINSNIISLPRKYFRMAQEGYFFRRAATVNSRFRTPVTALVYSMIWTCVLILSGSFYQLADLVVFVGYIFYGMLGVALIKLKMNGTIKEKVFGYPLAPAAFLLFAIALTAVQILEYPLQSLTGLLLAGIGIPFYYYFRKRNTGVQVKSPENL